MKIAIYLCVSVGLMTACSSSVKLQTDKSSADIRVAEEVGAAAVPRAALHLQLAKEEMTRAQKYARDGEGARARSMLSRAEVDAELAVALSREDAEQTEGEAAIERVKQLRQNNQIPAE